jgi:5-methylcytosine-specific restriction endonuclease McrA
VRWPQRPHEAHAATAASAGEITALCLASEMPRKRRAAWSQRIAHYDKAAHSPSLEAKLPSVASLKTLVRPSTHPAFTRLDVCLRDKLVCQYCGDRDVS